METGKQMTMDMDDMADLVPNFQYTSLDRSTRSIRLLRFDLAGKKRYHMHFILETFELAKCPPFVALSYTWGSSQSTHIIAVNQQQLPIRENLYRALEVLATDEASWVPARSVLEVEDTQTGYELIGTFYWIDYICINQDDSSERGHQVGLMEGIFCAASCVISWLGVPTEDSDRAIRALRRKVDLDKDTSWEDGSVENLLNRPFWRRIWIVQEFILPKRLLILCGHEGVWWESIRDNPSVFWDQVQRPRGKPVKIKHHNAFYLFQWRGIQQDTSFVGIVALSTSSDRASLAQATRPSLDALIRHFYKWECGDPRDRVYALLSLVTKDSRLITYQGPLEANYTISPQKLYYRVLAYTRNSPTLSGKSGSTHDFRIILFEALRMKPDREFLRNRYIYEFPEMRDRTKCSWNFSEGYENIFRLEGNEISFPKVDSSFLTLTPQEAYDDIIEYYRNFPKEEDPVAWRDFENALAFILGGYKKRGMMLAKSKLMYKLVIGRSIRMLFPWSEHGYVATELRRLINRISYRVVDGLEKPHDYWRTSLRKIRRRLHELSGDMVLTSWLQDGEVD